MKKTQFIKQLYQILPKSSVLVEAEELHPYECDGLSAYKYLPWLVVLPNTIEQIQQIVALCYSNSIPIIARGAGTGLPGLHDHRHVLAGIYDGRADKVGEVCWGLVG